MKKIFALCAAILVAACSATSQDARISIFPSVMETDIGNGVSLSITVDDARRSPLIGTYRDGAEITTSQDLAETIGLALVDSFSKQGFNVSAANNPSAVRMVVTLEGLTYTYDGQTISSSAETTSRVRVDVAEKGFIRTYNNSEQRTIPFAANQDTNNSQLSSTLGSMVEKIVNDPELISALLK